MTHVEEMHSVQKFHGRPYYWTFIPSQLAVILILTIWIATSLYLSITTLMGNNPLHDYDNKSGRLVFAGINMAFALICLIGYSVVFMNSRANGLYNFYTKIIAIFVLALICTLIANTILFGLERDNYIFRCKEDALAQIVKALPTNPPMTGRDNLIISDPETTFNCGRLFKVGLSFSITTTVLISLVYLHWMVFLLRDSICFVREVNDYSTHIHSKSTVHPSSMVSNHRSLPPQNTPNTPDSPPATHVPADIIV
ncbi:hypothetical protein BDB01DRAFT_810758 [Pilobolus umbonatus]|nr:hypothetical protein BDB01DRAFT_810758 [Pilobolus umbonatus]